MLVYLFDCMCLISYKIVPARLALPSVEQLNYFAEFIIEDGGEGIFLLFHLSVIQHSFCLSLNRLLPYLTINSYPQGIILQQFQAGYECGRSRSIMKFKVRKFFPSLFIFYIFFIFLLYIKRNSIFIDDFGRQRRNGNWKGPPCCSPQIVCTLQYPPCPSASLAYPSLHSPYCRLLTLLDRPNGMLFSVPFEDVHLSNLSIGDIVTFSCSNFTHRHTPVNPVIHKWRTDVSWKDVIRLYLQEQRYLGGK